MAEHKPVLEEVLLLDCMFGECVHDELPDCPPVKMIVCDTCRESWEDDAEIELFVGWPCQQAPALSATGTSGINGRCNLPCKPGHLHDRQCVNYLDPSSNPGNGADRG